MARRASAASCGQPDSVLSHMSEAYVLIFNLGKQNEGVYTLLGQAAKAAPYVLTFERIEDAERFAEQLSAEEKEYQSVMQELGHRLANPDQAGLLTVLMQLISISPSPQVLQQLFNTLGHYIMNGLNLREAMDEGFSGAQ